MMSFSDMSLVLLCFFALLLSMSSLDKGKFDNVREGMKEPTVEANKESLEELARLIRKQVKKERLQNAVGVDLDVDGLQIEFRDALLFKPGSATTNPKYQQAVAKVMNIISRSAKRYNIVIEGHTDDSPLRRGGRYPSNWELSAARGFRLLNSFKNNKVAEERLSVVAYAHTRPKVPYAGLKGGPLRQARAVNRRVVIRVE